MIILANGRGQRHLAISSAIMMGKRHDNLFVITSFPHGHEVGSHHNKNPFVPLLDEEHAYEEEQEDDSKNGNDNEDNSNDETIV
jgi:hypothetical protein